jgi:uncharacterized protein (TIGR03435 family)
MSLDTEAPVVIRRALPSVAVVGLLAFAVSAQEPRPTFDVTSVKRNMTEGPAASPLSFSPGRFVARNLTLRMVIAFVYREEHEGWTDRHEGGPSWLDTHLYDIEGKVLEGNPPPETLRAMARALLEDRFQLRVRRETREGPVFNLVLDRSDGRLGDHLRPSTGGDCTEDRKAAFATKVPVCGVGLGFEGADLQVKGHYVTPDQMTSHIRGFLDRPVINRTNLSGHFSFELKVTRPPEGNVDVPGGDAVAPGGLSALVPTAVREQLGLRLVNASGPVRVLVIDSVQQPTEN